MNTVYYRRAQFGLHTLHAQGVVVESDDTPTLHYYGTVTLSRRLSEAEEERYDVVEADSDLEASEAEDGALYRAETRAGA